MIKFIGKIIKTLFRLITLLVAISLGVTFALTIIYPLGYRADIVNYSEKMDVDPFLVASIIRAESNYYSEAKSPKDALGLMQITPKTGEWIAEQQENYSFTANDLLDTNININYGTWYLKRLFDTYESEQLVLAAYNAGMGNVNEWLVDKNYCKDGITLDRIPFKETDDYIEKVNSNYKIYKKLYGKLMYSDDVFTEYYFKGIIGIRDFVKKIKMKI